MTKARQALLIVLGLLALLWVVQLVNVADHYRLSYDLAIVPRQPADLPHILSAPFLHWSWAHIEGNSIPLVVLGFLAAYRSIPKFIGVSVIVILTSGGLSWLIDSTGSYSAGASGVIFGWFGYVIVRGFFNHDKIDIGVGLLAMLYYLPIFTLLLPAPHLGYQDHIGGLAGGLLCGWAFRDRPNDAAGAADPGRRAPRGQVATAPAPASPVRRVETELAALRDQIDRARDHHDGGPGK